MHWVFCISAATLDDDIDNQSIGCLKKTITQVEKMTGKRFQNNTSTEEPRKLAKKVLDRLVNDQATHTENAGKEEPFLIPNPELEKDPHIKQNPGVRVTPEEQDMENKGALEYTLQVEFSLKQNTTELGIFQQFTDKILQLDKLAKYLPWHGKEGELLPDIDTNNLPYSVVRGSICL